MKIKFYQSSFLVVILTLFISLLSCSKSDVLDDGGDIETETFVGHEGKYPGGWTSTTPSTSFTNYPVSAILRYSNAPQTKIKGEFFATLNFKSCCNLENDGTFTFEIENNQIKNFNLDDKIVGCEGTFKGNGTIAENGNLIIEFTGNDCDGAHVGTLVFRR